MLDNGKFSDIVIAVGRKEFKVHKNILAARSPVFARMFETDFKKTGSRMRITDMAVDVFEEMLRYIYTFKTVALDRFAKQLFVAANKVCQFVFI